MDEKENMYDFETTEYGGEITKAKYIEEIEYGIYSTQIMGLYVLFQASKRYSHKYNLLELFQKMFNPKVELKLSNIGKILLGINRYFIKTPLDSNAFDLLITQIIGGTSLRLKVLYTLHKNNNKKYIQKDLHDIFIDKIFTSEDIKQRTIEHVKDIEKILQFS